LRPSAQADVHRRLADAWAAVDSASGRHARARHLLAAVPAVDAAGAVDAAILVGAELVAARNPAEATNLLRRAVATSADHLPGDMRRRGRALVGLADAQWEAGELYPEHGLGRRRVRSAHRCRRPGAAGPRRDPASRHRHHFVPDHDRRRRIDEVLAALPEDDSPVRARLLGRAAVLATAVPSAIPHGHRLADAAIAIARRLGDPHALVEALSDRYFCVVDIADIDAREAAADEVVALAERTGRAEVALLGHEWRAGSRMARGDLDGADAALTDLESLALLRPTPTWRFAATLRRTTLLALRGDADGSIARATEGRDSARDLLDPVEARGLELENRMAVARVYGRADPRIAELTALIRGMGPAGVPPGAFAEVRTAYADHLTGDDGTARRMVASWAPRAHEVVGAVFGLPTTALLAELVVRLRTARHAATVAQALRPFAGRLPIDGGVTIHLPVDLHLATLAMMTGDVTAAVDHARDAVAFARGIGAPPLAARCLAVLADAQAAAGDATAARSARDAAEAAAEPVGVRLPPPGHAAPGPDAPTDARPVAAAAPRLAADGGALHAQATNGDRAATFRRDGAGWFVSGPHGDAIVSDAIGMGQLARLLDAPGRELAATDLAGSPDAPPPARDLGPALDATAKRAYRQRIAELQREIDEADAFADPERASRARLEMDALLAELRRAVGLGGRDRPQGSGDERARVNVARTLRRAIAAIERAVPDLGAHLSVSVRTGRFCAYDPEPAAALHWDVRR
jgi:hypothetical protein